jgi:hypothetical protein
MIPSKTTLLTSTSSDADITNWRERTRDQRATKVVSRKALDSPRHPHASRCAADIEINDYHSSDSDSSRNVEHEPTTNSKEKKQAARW